MKSEDESRQVNHHPWHRWFAKQIDWYVNLSLFGGLILFIYPDVLYNRSLLNLVLILVNGALSLAIYDTVLIRLFGNTPGRFAFSFRITDQIGERPGLKELANRSLRMSIFGLGMGVPIVSIFSQAVGYHDLVLNGKTRWDNKLRLKVVHSEIGPVRFGLFFAAIACLIGYSIFSLI